MAQLPVESMVHTYQGDYYQAINLSTKQADCAPFIEFMLNTILATIQTTGNNTEQISQQVKALLKQLQRAVKPLSRGELQAGLLLKDRESFRQRYLKPALQGGMVIRLC
jgi:hypothetical protein